MDTGAGGAAAGLIGRDLERAELDRVLEDARAGRGTTVLVAGEAGVGKSTLAAHLATSAAAHGMDVRWGRCSEVEGAPAFWPWRQVLGAWPDGEDMDRFTFLEGVVRSVEQLAVPDGALIVLEDLHWADDDSLSLLERVAVGLGTRPLVVAGTYRHDEVERGSALDRTIGGVATAGVLLELGGLAVAEVAALMRTISRRDVPVDAAETITGHTNGNPFFVSQVVRLLSRQGWMDDIDAGLADVPLGVRSVVRRRLDALDGEGATDVLTVAAAIGRSFDLAVVRAAAPDLPVTEAVDSAVRSGLLVADGRPGWYRFVHALVREVLESDAGELGAAEVHRRLLAVLEAAADPDPEAVASMARHALAAASLLDPGTVAGHLRRAAAHAIEAGGFEETVRLCGRALELGPSLDDRYEILLLRGRALFSLDDLPGSERVLMEAAALARSTGDDQRTAKALLEVGSGRLITGPNDALRRELWHTLQRIPHDDLALRAHLLSRYADLCRDPAEVESACREAFDLAVRSGDSEALVQAGSRLLLNGCVWMSMPERRSVVERLRSEVRPDLPEDLNINVAAMEVRVLLEDGRLEEAAAVARTVRDAFGRYSIVLHLLDPVNALVATMGGQLDRAAELHRAMSDEAERRGASEVLGPTMAGRELALARERDGGRSLLPILQAMRESVSPTEGVVSSVSFDIAHAVVLAENGEPERASEAIDRTLDADLERLALGWGGNDMGMTCLLVEAAHQIGRADVGARLGPLVRLAGDRNVVVGMPPIFALGHGSYFVGLCEHLTGRLDVAEERLEEARARNAAMRAAGPLARTHLALASVAADRGDGNRALQHLRRAHTLASESQLAALAATAAGRLGALGPASASDPATTTTFVFTDIVDSTARTMAAGDRSWLDGLAAHTSTVRALVARHGGRLVKALGDGYMLTFPTARQAILFTADLQADEGCRSLGVRIGVHTGEAQQIEGDHIGHHVNVAARVAGAASGGETLASETVCALVAGQADIVFGSPRTVQLKGIGDAVVRPLIAVERS